MEAVTVLSGGGNRCAGPEEDQLAVVQLQHLRLRGTDALRAGAAEADAIEGSRAFAVNHIAFHHCIQGVFQKIEPVLILPGGSDGIPAAADHHQRSVEVLYDRNGNRADSGFSLAMIGNLSDSAVTFCPDKDPVFHNIELVVHTVEPVLQMGALRGIFQPGFRTLGRCDAGVVGNRGLHDLIIEPVGSLNVREIEEIRDLINHVPIRGSAQKLIQNRDGLRPGNGLVGAERPVAVAGNPALALGKGNRDVTPMGFRNVREGGVGFRRFGPDFGQYDHELGAGNRVPGPEGSVREPVHIAGGSQCPNGRGIPLVIRNIGEGTVLRIREVGQSINDLREFRPGQGSPRAKEPVTASADINGMLFRFRIEGLRSGILRFRRFCRVLRFRGLRRLRRLLRFRWIGGQG